MVRNIEAFAGKNRQLYQKSLVKRIPNPNPTYLHHFFQFPGGFISDEPVTAKIIYHQTWIVKDSIPVRNGFCTPLNTSHTAGTRRWEGTFVHWTEKFTTENRKVVFQWLIQYLQALTNTHIKSRQLTCVVTKIIEKRHQVYQVDCVTVHISNFRNLIGLRSRNHPTSTQGLRKRNRYGSERICRKCRRCPKNWENYERRDHPSRQTRSIC